MSVLGGMAVSVLGAWWAWRQRHLTSDGAVAAAALGAAVFVLGGWLWGLLLVGFFVSSSLLSRYRERAKRAMAPGLAKGGRRDTGQVLANGGWAGVVALATLWQEPSILFFAFLGSIAAVNADTWATEIGMLSSQRPRRLPRLQPSRRGSSGAVTLLGLLASLTGGLFVGTLALGLILGDAWLEGVALPAYSVALPLMGGLTGLLASLFDSLLGGVLQGVYYCGICRQEVESHPDRLGHPSVLLRGRSWLDNDGVNFLSAVFGSVLGATLWWLL